LQRIFVIQLPSEATTSTFLHEWTKFFEVIFESS